MTDETPEHDEPATGRPGRQCTAAEGRARVAEVADLLARRWRRNEIRAYAREAWGVRGRQADYYIKRATTQLQEVSSAQVSEARAVLVAALDRQYRKADDAGDRQHALAALKELAKIFGLYSPAVAGKGAAEDGDRKAARLLGGVYGVEVADTGEHESRADEFVDDFDDEADDDFDDEADDEEDE